MEQAAKSRKSLIKAKSEELRLSCEDRSREVFESQTVECRICIGVKSETDTLAASMNDSKEVLIASSEDPASRINISRQYTLFGCWWRAGSFDPALLAEAWIYKVIRLMISFVMVIAFHKPENPVTYLCLKVLTGSRNAVTRSDSVVGCARTYSYLNFRFIGGQ